MKQTKLFNPVFIATQSPGVTYNRATIFAKNINGTVWPKQALTSYPNWEEILGQSSEILYEIENAVYKASHVIWQRLSTMKGLSTFGVLQQKYKVPHLLEIDDDVFNVDSSNPGSSTIHPSSEAYYVFKKQLQMSAGVIVTTGTLKDSYWHFNKRIWIVGNCIDKKKWNLKRKKHSGIFIGWQGGVHHDTDLRLLMPVVPKILKKYKDVEFHFVGHRPDCFNIDRCILHAPVLVEEHPKNMAEVGADIMIAPLYDTHLNRARSNLRAIESGALHTPIVASGSRRLPYYNILHKSDGGILANTTQEWVDGLSKLIDNEGVRNRMGDRLYEEVESNYDSIQVSRQYADILKRM